MIRPVLQLLTSPDLHNMEAGPDDPHNCYVLVQALIGLEGEAGGEVFYFQVCTPSALAQLIPSGKGLSGKSFLFVEVYDYGVVRDAIISICADAARTARNWDEFALAMCRYSDWEYERDMA